MSKLIIVGVSVGFHVGLAFVLGELRVERASAATPIEITEVARPAPKEPPPPVKVDPVPEPEPRAPRPRAPKPAAAPEPAPAPEAPPSFENVPDFGLALEGSVGTGGGLAVPAAPKASSAPRVVKELAPALRAEARDECSEKASKPKPVSVPQPVYTEAARAAGVEGRVRVELTVDEQGNVVLVKVLEGLGYGLDEAALSAAKGASFTPAERCGRAVRATFTIAMRFSVA